MNILNQLFAIASISKYANAPDSNKIETRIVGMDALSDSAREQVTAQFSLLKRVSFKLDDQYNVYCQLSVSKAGRELIWFNVCPVPVTEVAVMPDALIEEII